MIVVEKEDGVVDDEVCGCDGDNDYEEYEQEEYAYVVRKLMLSPKCGDETQCHNLFRIRCTVQGSLCDLTIDSGSQENILSKDVMEGLRLEMETHPNLDLSNRSNRPFWFVAWPEKRQAGPEQPSTITSRAGRA